MFKIDIDPISKPRQTKSDKFRKRDCVLRYRAFADDLRLKCNLNGYKLGNKLNIVFTIPMPKSWPKKKKKEMDGKPHQQTPDIDNLCKAVMDALSKDDSFVYSILASKYWGEKGSIHIY